MRSMAIIGIALLLATSIAGCFDGTGTLAVPPLLEGSAATYRISGHANVAVAGVPLMDGGEDRLRMRVTGQVSALMAHGVWSDQAILVTTEQALPEGFLMVMEQVFDPYGVSHSWTIPNDDGDLQRSMNPLGPDLGLTAWFAGVVLHEGETEISLPTSPGNLVHNRGTPIRWTVDVDDGRATLSLDLDSVSLGDRFTSVIIVYDETCPWPRSMRSTSQTDGLESFQATRIACEIGAGEQIFEGDVESSPSFGPAPTWRHVRLAPDGVPGAATTKLGGFSLADALHSILDSDAYSELCEDDGECTWVKLAWSEGTRQRGPLETVGHAETVNVSQWGISVHTGGERLHDLVAVRYDDGQIEVEDAGTSSMQALAQVVLDDGPRWLLSPAETSEAMARLYGSEDFSVVWILVGGDDPPGYGGERKSVMVFSAGSSDLREQFGPSGIVNSAGLGSGGRLRLFLLGTGPVWQPGD